MQTEIDQLRGRYRRLQRELAAAVASEIWDSPRTHRLARDLSATERELAALRRDASAPVVAERHRFQRDLGYAACL